MTEREREILGILRENPLINQKDLAKQLGIERSSVAVHITNLMKKGIIQGKGYIINDEKHVCVIGGSNVDIVGKASVLKANDSAIGSIQLSAGGVGRNIAEAIARLEVPVKLLSAVGSDVHGELILKACRRVGVDVNQVHVDRMLSTSAYMAMLSGDGDMAYAINDMQNITSVSAGYIREHQHMIKHASVVVIDANLTSEALEMIGKFELKRLIADPVSAEKTDKLKPLLLNLYGLKPNRIEAQRLTGVKIETLDDAVAAIDILHQQGVKHIALSMGADGLLASDQEQVIHFRNKAISAVNATGAGDVFTATWAASLQQGFNFFDAIKRSMIAARFNVQSELTIHEALCKEQIEIDMKEVEIYENILRHPS
ncbi:MULTISPECIES: PfkB family carbohydrate kinase [unclassified Fusibacter]|uniref:PfkB family carbohydrate kinase n=1 Tax=unclassified Fusibacter TaxID=2624464 RepID=UPI0010109133|nr:MULTISPECIES: PfkB family carbohydrate kinase [unclassified Fusibacter]MCK8060531.1 PfkB family carbohydrate kinase [Fusibacter sp. A2]NPE23015.1 winged helix-turn-helix transcriptional regulator [Fusibacter sp. A1]RXV60080.1 winged helix-turn-helix transcriptional regulator [Fusibacter sp. A1]